MKKPNQVIDEITNVIYPPAEAIVNELNTIRAIVNPTIAMYETTEDIHTIQPNLDMMQRAIDYLRGAPMRDELKPLPEDTLNPSLVSYSSGLNITIKYTKENEYDMMVTGNNVEPHIHYPGLFGDLDIDVVTMELGIPVICGHRYAVAQTNPILSLYQDDEFIEQTEDNDWIKTKEYFMEDDTFEYAFLVPSGRNQITISIQDIDAKDSDQAKPIIFNITTHIHFKEQEQEEEEIVE